MSLVSFFLLHVRQDIASQFSYQFFLNFILFLPYALFPPGISLIAQLISLLHFQTISFLSFLFFCSFPT